MARLLSSAAIAPSAAAAITTRGDAVSAELRRWAAEPFDMTRANCGLSVIAYAERVTGGSVIPSPRDMATVAMLALAAQPTEFGRYASWCLEQLGCPLTQTPLRGDVGLVELENGLTACLCVASPIATSGTGRVMWAARMTTGVLLRAEAPVMAWRVECLTP